MTTQRAPVRLTTRVLTLGSLGAGGVLAVGLLLDVAGQEVAAGLVGNIGVLVLLATPPTGLIASWWELKPSRRVHAWLALAVLLVLLLATVIALLTRP